MARFRTRCNDSALILTVTKADGFLSRFSWGHPAGTRVLFPLRSPAR